MYKYIYRKFAISATNGACYGSIFNLNITSNVNLSCDASAATSSGSCYGLILNSETSQNVDINCNENACALLQVYADHSKSVTITAFNSCMFFFYFQFCLFGLFIHHINLFRFLVL